MLKKMRVLPFLILTISTAIVTVPKVNLTIAQNLSLSENSTFFTGQPPSLVSADTPANSINWPDPNYYFTIKLPENSGESLGKVTIHQQENIETIEFNLSNTKAFEGNPHQRGKDLSLKAVMPSKQAQTIVVSFDPPISPGTTFTISLQAKENPSQTGIYLFRVQAFPSGTAPVGLDLGVGRFQFYDNF